MTRRIWDTLPYSGTEPEMLRMHLEETSDFVHRWVITEAETTFLGDPKPIGYDPADFPEWADRIIHVVAEIPDTDNPWMREFEQRDAAWGALIDAGAELDDVVIIGDADEIPSLNALRWRGWPVVALQMRTGLFAVDWVVPGWYRLPTQAVMATVRWLKARDGKLAQVRHARGQWPVMEDGGWHFSWLGGPDVIAEKLDKGTSHHSEIVGTLEEQLIRTGKRWRDGASGPTGAPVEPADIDGTWPAMIRDRRCPELWFRPEDARWVKPAADDPAEIMQYLWSGWRPGDLAFEVGANHGQSIPRMTEAWGRVVAFEPFPASYAIASMTPGSDVRLAAVSDHEGVIVLTAENDQLLSPQHEGYTRLGLDVNAVMTVPCVTLNSVAAEEGIPVFCNVDVEGHEMQVLYGASALLTAGTQWLIEFHSEDLHDRCVAYLEEAGYRVETVRHPHYAPGSEFWSQHGWLKARKS